ncbi:ShET2/EspL2 family type III secretion system effector toxin [Trinickia sp. LjRoot230]|uniref:ShET2/EspL2 family type III secretion system effector toxin n=1 Tax=Trinickia sp. LjRoot230 TaxID=3342288 RepID=UPI003ED07734
MSFFTRNATAGLFEPRAGVGFQWPRRGASAGSAPASSRYSERAAGGAALADIPSQTPHQARHAANKTSIASAPRAGLSRLLGAMRVGGRSQALLRDGGELDLSHLRAGDIQDLRRLLRDKPPSCVTTLRLPTGLKLLPSWISSLRALERIEIGEFAGSELRLANPMLKEVHVRGANLRTIDIPVEARAYCRDAAGVRERMMHVRYRDPRTREVVSEGAAIGHLHLESTLYGAIDRRNLNDSAVFDRGRGAQRVCTNLAMGWLQALQRHRAANALQPFSKVWAQRLSSAGKLEEVTGLKTERDYSALRLHGSERYLTGHSQWGAFMRSQFEAMQPGDHKQFLLLTSGHPMAVELAVDAAPKNKPQHEYVATLYDPNMTANQAARIVEVDLDAVTQWQVGTFLDSDGIERCYGSVESHCVSEFIAVPPNFADRKITRSAANSTDNSVVLSRFLADGERMTPGAVHMLFQSGELTPEVLRECVASCNSAQERMAMLAARGKDGVSGMTLACAGGHRNAVLAAGRVIGELCEAGLLSGAQALELLEGRNSGSAPAAAHALSENGELAFVAFSHMLQMGVHEGWLSRDEAATAFAARWPDGDGSRTTHGLSAFHYAMWHGLSVAALTYCKALDKLVEHGAIAPERVFELLRARRSDGTDALASALLHDQARTVGLIGKLLASPFLAAALTREQVIALLDARTSDGRRAFAVATEEKRTAACDAFAQVVYAVQASGTISRSDADYLLSVGDERLQAVSSPQQVLERATSLAR